MKRFADRDLEQMIGNLLRAGVLLAAAVVALGGLAYLARHGGEIPDHSVFRGEPKAWSTWSGLVSPRTLSSGRAIIMTGLVLLILTPVARVALSLAAFVQERDWLYVGISSLVLGLLLYSLSSS